MPQDGTGMRRVMAERILIIGGGKINYSFAGRYLSENKFDTVTCADAGLDAAEKLGISTNFLIGDFDSIKKETLSEFMEKDSLRQDGKRYIQLPKEKDYTDMHLVLEWAVAKKPSEIIILGATGGRLDHFIANLNILMLPLDNNIPAYIIDEYNKICLINNEYRINRQDLWGKYISIYPFTEKVTGVSLKGFKYPLNDRTIQTGTDGSLTTSNEMAEDAEEAIISFGEGVLIVVQSRDTDGNFT